MVDLGEDTKSNDSKPAGYVKYIFKKKTLAVKCKVSIHKQRKKSWKLK